MRRDERETVMICFSMYFQFSLGETNMGNTGVYSYDVFQYVLSIFAWGD